MPLTVRVMVAIWLVILVSGITLYSVIGLTNS
jgi:hypothetical protein